MHTIKVILREIKFEQHSRSENAMTQNAGEKFTWYTMVWCSACNKSHLAREIGVM
jgi:hypothetical protein